jgi:hypothetical protein
MSEFIRHRMASTLFYGLTTLMIVISIISFVKGLSWINTPFPGFTIYRPPYVGSMSITDWPGKKAGLEFLERIVSVDNQPVLEGQDVVAAVKQKKPGTPVHYVVKSKGKIREVTVPVTIFDMKDFFLVFSIAFLGGLILYALGFIVYLLKPKTSTSWVFFIACLCVGIYMVTGFDSQSSYFLNHINYLALCLMPATFFHLFLIFPDRKRVLTRLPALEYLIYVPVLIILMFYLIYYLSFPEILSSNSLSWMLDWKGLGTVTRVFMLFCSVGFIILLFHSMFKASTILARQRAQMILFGVTIGFLPPAMIMSAAYFLDLKFPFNFLTFFVILFPASIAYSIVRHNLFDADVIIKRTVGYAVVTAIVVGAYAVVSIVLNVFMGKYQVAQSRAFPILFTLGVILVFNPLRNRIQSLVDRIFFRKE